MTNLESILKSRDITLLTKVPIVKAMVFQQSCVDVRVGTKGRLNTEALMLSNCGAGEDSWESLGQDQTSQFQRKSVLNIHWKDSCLSSNTSATWWEEQTHWKRFWCWEILKVGEGDERGWDSWMASPTWWTWVWANSRRIVTDREAWCAVLHGVRKSWKWLSNCKTATQRSPN